MCTTASGKHAHIPNSPRFTPGPWRRLSHRLIVADHGSELPICDVWSGGVGIEQADANENLIAAAPDLFAALAAVVAECSKGYHLIPNRLLVQAREALQIAQEGR